MPFAWAVNSASGGNERSSCPRFSRVWWDVSFDTGHPPATVLAVTLVCVGAGGGARTPALPTYSTGMRTARASEWPHRPGGRAIREANGVELLGVSDLVYRCVIAASRAVFRGLGLRIELRGEEHLPEAGGAVLAGNHLSFLDFTFLGLVGVERGRLVRFLCKESVFGPPVVGWAMRRMGHIDVDRAHGEVALRHAVRAVRSGEVVGVFPEGTISRSWTLRSFRPGAAAVAVREQVPLVPVAMWGSHRILTVGGRFSLRRGTAVTILVGEPLHPGPGADPAAVTHALRARIDDLLEQAMDAYPDRPRRHTDRWWLPASRGGSAPTPEVARVLDDAAMWGTGRPRRGARSAG